MFLVAMIFTSLISANGAMASTRGDPCGLRVPYERSLMAAVAERFSAGEFTRVEVLTAEMRLAEAEFVCEITSEERYAEVMLRNMAELVLLTRRAVAAGSLRLADLTVELIREINLRMSFQEVSFEEFCTVKQSYLNGQLAYAHEQFNVGEVFRSTILAAELEIARHREECILNGIELP